MHDPALLARLSGISEEEQAILRSEGLNKSIYTDHGGFTIDNKKMLEKGKLIALRPHTRFIDFPNHNHNYIEIMYVLTGQITHVINGAQITLRQGELLFMSRNTYHAIQKAGETDVAVNFIILPQFFAKAYEMIDHDNTLSQFVTQNLLGIDERISHLHFKVSDVRPVQNLVENMMLDILGKQPNRRSICSITMGLLFLQLLNHTELIDMQMAPDHEMRLTLAILREIEENYRDASLTALAKKYNQTVYALSRLIKKHMGKTFKQLLQEKRFTKAKQLLGSTTLSVADISAYVGYENTSYFHRAFLSRYHVSPSKYRESKRAQQRAAGAEE